MNDISEALSLQPDPSFSQNSQTGPGIIVEGGEAGEVDVQAENITQRRRALMLGLTDLVLGKYNRVTGASV